MPDETQELEALGLVLGLVGGTWKRADTITGPNGQHDFDIGTGSHSIALEVTSTTVGEVRSMWKAVGKQSWDCTKAKCGWSISLEAAGPGTRGASVGEIRKHIEDHLVVLEQAGVDHFGGPHNPPTDPIAANAVLALAELGVRAGGCVGTPPRADIAPLILVGTAGPAGISDPANINIAVELAINANIEKLRKALVDERHLFVWVDSTDLRCFAPLSFGTLPPSPPTLPEGIDRVWVAAHLPGPRVPTSVLWTVGTNDSWESSPVRYRDPLENG